MAPELQVGNRPSAKLESVQPIVSVDRVGFARDSLERVGLEGGCCGVVSISRASDECPPPSNLNSFIPKGEPCAPMKGSSGRRPPYLPHVQLLGSYLAPSLLSTEVQPNTVPSGRSPRVPSATS